MRISPTTLALFLGRAGESPVSLQLEESGIRVLRKEGEELVSYEQIEELCLRSGLFWASLFIHLKDETFVAAKGLVKVAAASFHREGRSKQAAYHDKCLANQIVAQSPAISSLAARIREATSGSSYLRYRHCEALRAEVRQMGHLLAVRRDLLPPAADLTAGLDLLDKFTSAPEKLRQDCNHQFVANELERFKEFFDKVEPHPLTSAQRLAVVTDEDNTLVIAGAGSGKTSVMVAKAGYLVRRGICNPEQILLLAFARDAKEEIEERLQKRVGVTLKAATFHSLGLEIIAAVEGKKPMVAAESSDSVKMAALLRGLLSELQQKPEFAELIKHFFGYHLVPYRSLFDFKCEGDYWDYLQAHEVRSLQGDVVKSFEELEIANFLFLNGIKYEYERPYRVDTATATRRQYQPDFTILEPEIYIEHFCLNKNHRTPFFVDELQYKNGVLWKRHLHAQQHTKLIETYSYQKKEGTLLAELERKLKEAGVKFNPISPESMFRKLTELGAVDKFTKLLATVLNHFKSNQHTIETVRARKKPAADNDRIEAFLKIFAAVYAEYQARLQRAGDVDFNDMISKATQYVEAGRYRSTFEYVLVDEFQDISVGRARLLKALLHQNPNARLCCVGDDWQAIYRFAGSDIALMRHFEQHFGHRAEQRLDRTFRYNNQINDLSSKFILQNPNQIPKSLAPHSSTDSTCVWIHRAENANDQVLRRIVDHISQHSQGKKASVLMLGRYNHLAPTCIPQLAREFPSLSLKYLTVHRSKGLEEDYVIILGLAAGRFGFPSEVADDPILDLVLSEPEPFPHAEERRLFYVALTRARKAVHLIVDPFRPSVFVQELTSGGYNVSVEGEARFQQTLCPVCKTGLIVPGKTNRESYVCTHAPFCKYSPPRCPKCKVGFLLSPGEGAAPACTNPRCGNEGQLCPSCKVGVQVVRRGPYRPFIGCSRYPDCEYKARLPNSSGNMSRGS